MVWRFCNTSSKSYAHRQSLFKHKKRCGNGITNYYCDECCGGSLLGVINYLLEIFRGMGKDDLVEDIVENIYKAVEKDTIRESLYNYKKSAIMCWICPHLTFVN